MPSGFATPDIAALVASFPPASPTRHGPSLIRSFSGNSLYCSPVVLERFRALLETAPTRIRLSDLPASLNVERTAWLLEDGNDVPIFYARDRQSLIPHTELESMAEKLAKEADARPVGLAAFARDADIAPASLETLLSARSSSMDVQQISGDGQFWVASSKLVANVQHSLRDIIESGSANKINLSRMYQDVPTAALRCILAATVAGDADQVQVEDGALWYVPQGFHIAIQKQQKARHDAILRRNVEKLTNESYCIISHISMNDIDGSLTGPACLQQDIVAAALVRNHDIRPIVLRRHAGEHLATTIIISEKLLDVIVKDINNGTYKLFQRARAEGKDLSIEEIQAADVPVTVSTPTLVHLVIESEDRYYLREALRAAHSAFSEEDLHWFAAAYRRSLMATVSLYVEGIEAVTDAILREHLQEYLSDHFRREILRNFAGEMKARHLMLEKNRAKEYEKAMQACDESKTLTATRTAIFKGARRLKVEAPSSDDTRQMKLQILQLNAKAIRKMTRSSDVLQNVTWILLGCCSGGLYMSAGKDTSRMIKHYQMVGDEAFGSQLARWRDLLKAGNESRQDLESMQALAQGALDRLAANEKFRAND